MATWVGEVTTSKGGNISMVVSGGYGTVSRSGSTVSFNWGVRFKQGSSTYTYNSISALPDGSNWYAIKSKGTSHTSSGTWYYATSTSSTVTKYTTEAIPFYWSGSVGSVDGGNISITVGTAWDEYTPDVANYNYTFSVPYPAAASYSVTYNANGGSGAPGSQTKYQGYNLTLSSSQPTRSGFAFTGWSGSDGVTYQPGATFSGNYNLTLTAQWTATNPVFSAPSLKATETSITYSGFTVNVSSTVSYQVNGGSWQSAGSGTSIPEKTIPNLNPGTSYTINFKAVNNSGGAETTHSNSINTYNWPSIISISKSTIDVGATQTISLYNPLKHKVLVTVASANYSGSTETEGTTANLVIPLDMGNDVSKNTTHTASVTYTSTYNAAHPSSVTGTINLTNAVGAPTIITSKTESFVEISDIAKIVVNGTNHDISEATGSTSKYLQTKSKLRYRLLNSNNPFEPKYGATISQYTVKINSKDNTPATIGTYYYEGTTGGTSSSGSAQTMTANNTYVLTISATDNRGFTSSYTKSFTTYPYAIPSLGIPTIIRNDGYGTQATVTVVGSWVPNMNGKLLAKSVVLKYKEMPSGSEQTYTLYDNTNGSKSSYRSLAYSYNLGSAISFNSGKSYEVWIVATDWFGGTATSQHGSLTLGTPLVFIDAEQQALGVNMFPEGKGLYVDGTIKGTGNITANSTSGVVSGRVLQGTLTSYDTRNENNPPSYYYEAGTTKARGITNEFKSCASINSPWSSGYCNLITITPWNDASGGRPIQIAINSDGTSKIRTATSDTAWSAWLWNSLEAYPIGAVYLSWDGTSPASLFGGEWQRLSGGFIYGCVNSPGTSGSGTSTGDAGGGNTGGTTLTAAQSGVPAHNHGASGSFGANFYIRHGQSSGTATVAAGTNTSVETGVGTVWSNGFSTSSYSHNIDRVNIGGSVSVSVNNNSAANASSSHSHSLTAHNHTVPYIAVYAWRRTG